MNFDAFNNCDDEEYKDHVLARWGDKQKQVIAVKKNYHVGRPNRTTVINDDDINNLRIALNTCKTINEFIKAI